MRGWGIAFFVPQLAGHIKDVTGGMDDAFYLSGGLLAAAVIVSCLLRPPRRPSSATEAILTCGPRQGDAATRR
jgi:hypothetical protein